MKNKFYPHLFEPLQIGTLRLPNRIAMVPTDISSANADGSVNQRVITYHEEIRSQCEVGRRKRRVSGRC